MCSTMIRADTTTKVYTLKELVLIDTLITEFNDKFYIPEIQNWYLI